MEFTFCMATFSHWEENDLALTANKMLFKLDKKNTNESDYQILSRQGNTGL